MAVSVAPLTAVQAAWEPKSMVLELVLCTPIVSLAEAAQADCYAYSEVWKKHGKWARTIRREK
eukprot:scaffold264587_cov15-Tisochrysis_lutea.AAC.1